MGGATCWAWLGKTPVYLGFLSSELKRMSLGLNAHLHAVGLLRETLKFGRLLAEGDETDAHSTPIRAITPRKKLSLISR